jgi:hypothetical protein
MVDRLIPARRPRAPGARRLAFAGLVVAVAVLHGIVTHDLGRRLAAAEAEARTSMPARIEVAYVRTLEPEPARVAAAAPAPARAPAQPRRAPKAAPAASAVAAAPPRPASAADAAGLAEAAPAPDAAAAASTPDSPASDAATVLAEAAAAAAAPAAEAPASAASAPVGTFSWPSATRVSYLLTGHWRGDLTGRAEVEWIRVGARYQVNVDLFAGPEFAPVFSRRMTSEGRLAETGLAPDRYDEETQVLMRERRRVSVLFEADAVTLADGQRREHLAGVQDSASQFIHFTWLFGTRPERLRVGNRFDVPLALPRSMTLWTYEVAAEETLHTSFGPLATYHLKPRREGRKSGEWLVDMWFAPELRFLPVRIRIEQEVGSYVDLVIAKKPEIAAS